MTDPDWVATTTRNARFETLGLPGPLGYIAARCAPLERLGPLLWPVIDELPMVDRPAASDADRRQSVR